MRAYWGRYLRMAFLRLIICVILGNPWDIHYTMQAFIAIYDLVNIVVARHSRKFWSLKASTLFPLDLFTSDNGNICAFNGQPIGVSPFKNRQHHYLSENSPFILLYKVSRLKHRGQFFAEFMPNISGRFSCISNGEIGTNFMVKFNERCWNGRRGKGLARNWLKWNCWTWVGIGIE